MVDCVHAMHIEPHAALSNYVAIQGIDVLAQVDGAMYITLGKLCSE